MAPKKRVPVKRTTCPSPTRKRSKRTLAKGMQLESPSEVRQIPGPSGGQTPCPTGLHLPGPSGLATPGPSGLQIPASGGAKKQQSIERYAEPPVESMAAPLLPVTGPNSVAATAPDQPLAIGASYLATLVAEELKTITEKFSAENEALRARVNQLEQLPNILANQAVNMLPPPPDINIQDLPVAFHPELPTAGPLIPNIENAIPPLVPQVPQTPQLAGGPSGNFPSFITTAIPVGSLLNKTLREKISNDVFFHFSEIIDNNEDLGASYLSVTQAGCKLVPSAKKGRFLDWSEFVSAWNVFVAVRTRESNDPALPGHLAKHFEVLFNLNKADRDWSWYDTKFRSLIDQKMACWGQVHAELNDKARSMEAKKPIVREGQVKSSHSEAKGDTKNKKCFKYHAGAKCKYNSNCMFSHNCPNCGKPHSQIHCPDKQPFRGAPQQTIIASRNPLPKPSGRPAQYYGARY